MVGPDALAVCRANRGLPVGFLLHTFNYLNMCFKQRVEQGYQRKPRERDQQMQRSQTIDQPTTPKVKDIPQIPTKQQEPGL